MGVVNLYQIFDTKQMEVVADGVTAAEVVTLLGIDNVQQVTRAAAVSIRIKRRYRIEVIDRAIPTASPLWVEWDSIRKLILKRYRPGRSEANGAGLDRARIDRTAKRDPARVFESKETRKGNP